GVVRGVDVVLGEGDGAVQLDWNRPDLGAQAQPVQQLHQLGIEVLHRLGRELHAAQLTAGGGDVEPVVEKVEVDGEAPAGLGGHERCGEPAGRDVEGRVPPFVKQG